MIIRQPVTSASSMASCSECRSVMEYMRVSMDTGRPKPFARRQSASISSSDAPGV